MRKQEKVSRDPSAEIGREIPDWPEIPKEVIQRFPSMAEHQRRQREVWYALRLLLRDLMALQQQRPL